MEWTRRQGRTAALLVLVAACVLSLAGLSSFGIWDPWELAPADRARDLAAGTASALDRPPLTLWLVASGFSAFGIHEWSGRLPVALAGLCAVALAYLLVARFAGRRAGVWAALVTTTSPLFLLNARQMLGAAPAMAASAAVFLCALAALATPRLRPPSRTRNLLTAAWLVGLAASVVLATLASGVLLGVAPPLLAVGVTVLARGDLVAPWRDARRTLVAGGLLWAALVAGVGAASAVWTDYAGFGYWTGGVPRGGAPPTWEVGIERVFHAFAPWSALLPIALARMLRRPPAPAHRPLLRHPEENALRLGVVAWVAFGFAATTLHTARYGPAPFVPLVGLAAAVSLLIRDVERDGRRAFWGAAIVAVLFAGLVVRDYRAYPNGPIEGLAAEGIEVPADVFNPIVAWAILIGVFAALVGLGLASDPTAGAYPRLRADLAALRSRWRRGEDPWRLAYEWARVGFPIGLLREQWRRGRSFAAWLVALALLVSGVVGFATISFIVPELLMQHLGFTTLSMRIARGLLFLPPGLVVLIAVVRLALLGFGRLRSYRLLPAGVAALALGGYTSLGFLPELSSHFSPREVYDTYNELASRGEPLGEYRVGGRAAAYYATGEIQELDSPTELLSFLRQERRVWAAFRADDLASVNRDYRRAVGRHLFVADARSARMILATNLPIEGRDNQNYLADAVLDEAPRPQHAVAVDFDRRIELLGYDLELPRPGYVGPGEAFHITWYFRVNAPVPGSYQPFVHIDGPGQRINGDHEPVGGRYPVRLWEPGDIIVDRQELRVPANYRRGDLTIYMGFFSGEQRLEIVAGPEDDVNRARLGVLAVR